MDSKSAISYMLILTLILGALQSGLAQWVDAPISYGPTSGGTFEDQKGVYECFLTFYTTAPTCLTEILNTVMTGRLSLGPFCCNMIKDVKDECWQTLFPVSPDLPPFLKEQCDKHTNF
ncbi:hypothetical protein RND81_08G018100 [Saponaria officinalis]|uniref:Prolamin-like domain-containing protein n=1 Tax=Saponaria officinalis TaxID=3572 RepID=A0AAW1J2C6_SAPOF